MVQLDYLPAGGSRDLTQSPPTVSAKREYSRTWPETLANWRSEITDLGVWRRKRTREKPSFAAHSRFSRGAWPDAGMPGWQRSADRTRLRANSLLTGNFTGNFAILGLRDAIWYQETAALQPLLEQFPTQTNRENILRNREFLAGNREFYLQKGKK
jgi:hypothetical protein